MRLNGMLLVFTFVGFCLSGCQEIRGPVWSPDGKRVAYTTYTSASTPTGYFDTNLYMVETEQDNAVPELLAKGAAFPNWKEDSILYLGERDAQGFYTKLLKQKINVTADGTVALASQPLVSGLKLTSFQMSADGSMALLCAGQNARVNPPIRMALLNLADNARTDLSTMGDVFSPALTPNGRFVAYTQKIPAALPLLIVCPLDSRQTTALFPTAENSEPNASCYIIHAFPDNEQFLFYSPGGANIWTIRRDGTNIRKFPLPEGVSSPLMVAISEDSSSVSLTVAQAISEKVLYQVYKLEFQAKRFIKLDGESSELLGGHVSLRRKNPTRYAWLTAAGLAVGEPGKAKYFPMTATQCLAASALQLQQNEPELASASVQKAHELQPPPEDPGAIDRADTLAFLASKQMDQAISSFERSTLLFPVGPDGLTFIFPANTGLPHPTPEMLSASLKTMDDLIRAVPDNQLVPKLRQALLLRSQSNQKQALELYQQCVPILADEARVGGIRFLEALCAFESGDVALAAEKWESAARSAEFPQADYAAGLSAMAYLLSEKAEGANKANAVLQLPVIKNSPLAQELSGLAAAFKGRVFHDNNLSKEAVSADGSTRTWVQIERYQVPIVSLKPVRIEEEGKFSERRIGLKATLTSSVWLAGMQQPIFRIPRPITIPIISPDNTKLAFSVSGEVFPLPETPCDIFVINTQGALLLGDVQTTFTGKVRSRYNVKNITWSSPQEITATAARVDIFGHETPLTRIIAVPATGQKGASK